MKIVDPNSLGSTLDALNETFFYGRPLSKSQRLQAARWIAGRQGKAGSYASMFGPTQSDFKEGVKLFTGERVRSGAATGHILGEEACRTLILLDVSTVRIRNALNRATLGMLRKLEQSEAGRAMTGIYCCGTCTCSLWRHLVVGGLGDIERRLAAGMKALKTHRDGDGRWKRFPFHYTLLALSEIDLPSAIEEMRYASSVCKRHLRRSPRTDKTSQRRRLLARTILEKC